MFHGYTKSWRKKYSGRSASRGLLYIGAMDWLVGNANWEDSWYNGAKIERGQIVVGRKMLSSIWKVSEQTVRTILANLETDGFLTIKSTNRFTTLTICNFDTYNPKENCINQQINQQSTNNQPHLNNEKNINISYSKEYSSENAVQTVFSFDEFWDTYGKKVDRAKCEKMYAKISESDRAVIKHTLPAYVASTPEVKYRKNPQTYLNGKCWNDEIINTTEDKNNGRGGSYGRYVVRHGR